MELTFFLLLLTIVIGYHVSPTKMKKFPVVGMMMYGIVCHDVALSRKKNTSNENAVCCAMLCYTMLCAIAIAPIPPCMSMEASIIAAAADGRNPAISNTHYYEY